MITTGGAPRARDASIAATTLAIVVVLTLGVGGGCDDPTRTLTGDEIRRQFSNKTLRGTHHRRGYTFHSYWDADGTFRSYQGGSKTPRNGRWWLEGGDQICIEWQDTGERFCRNIVVDDEGNYHKELIKGNGRHIRLVSYHSFVDGNPDGL